MGHWRRQTRPSTPAAAALAHQLIRLEAALDERQIKRSSNASIERYRAGLALKEARKAVASIQTSKTQS